MIRVFLLLLCSTAALAAAEPLAEKIKKRMMQTPELSGKSVAHAVAEVSTEYEKAFGEILPLYLRADLLRQPPAAPSRRPRTDVPGLQPRREKPARPSGENPAEATLDAAPLKVPVYELLRYLTALADLTFTVQDDAILIHPRRP